MNFRLSEHVREILSELQSEETAHSGFQESLEDAETLLRQTDTSTQVTLVGSLAVSDLGPDFLTGVATVFAHCESRLRVLYAISCYRLLDLIEVTVDGLNRGRFPRTVLGARSLVEHAAICSWRQRELAPLLDSVKDIKPSSLRKCKGDAERTASIIDIIFKANLKLEEAYGAGRFNRDVLSDLKNLRDIELKLGERHRQIGVMDAIDDLVWTGPLLPATTPRFYYELLCDYVHPNVGSNFLHINREDYTDLRNVVTGSENRLIHMEIARDILDKSLYLHILSVISIPVREAVRGLLEYTLWLKHRVDERCEFQQRLREMGINALSTPP